MKKVSLLCIFICFLLCQGSRLYDFHGRTNKSTRIHKQEKIYREDIKEKAFDIAVKFVNSETEYKKGKSGKDNSPFDCSGLVIRCYYDAVKGTRFKLPFKFTENTHPSAETLYERYVIHTEKPEKGDLIFLNYDRNNSKKVKHVGIFDSYDKEGYVHFIDATDYEGYDKVVDYRKIKRNDKAIIGYGILKIR